jgi:hypothetical protein
MTISPADNNEPTLGQIVVRSIKAVVCNLRQLRHGPVYSAILGIIVGFTMSYKVKGLLCGLILFTTFQCVKAYQNRDKP